MPSYDSLEDTIVALGCSQVCEDQRLPLDEDFLDYVIYILSVAVTQDVPSLTQAQLATAVTNFNCEVRDRVVWSTAPIDTKKAIILRLLSTLVV